MAGKIGHHHTRDPYPWDGVETLKRSSAWNCCNMNLPSTFYVCPICGEERKITGKFTPDSA